MALGTHHSAGTYLMHTERFTLKWRLHRASVVGKENGQPFKLNLDVKTDWKGEAGMFKITKSKGEDAEVWSCCVYKKVIFLCLSRYRHLHTHHTWFITAMN